MLITFLILSIDMVLYHHDGLIPSSMVAPQPVLQKKWMTIHWNYKDARRLGNELFGFAATLGIGRHHGMSIMVSKNMKLTEIFELPDIRVVENQEVSLGMYVKYKERKSYDCKFDERAMTKHPSHFPYNVALYGYFQSWRYFHGVQDELLSVLKFKSSVLGPATSFHRDLLERYVSGGTYTVIGVHVRRGDMLKQAKIYAYGYVEAPVSYFEHAVKYFKDTLHGRQLIFVVCSDEISWAKEHLSHLHENLVFSKHRQAWVDLAILSLCDHVIVSTGSFGWWAAWLANGTTLYYKNWPRRGSGLDRNLRKADYFFPHWIPLE